MNAVVWWKEYRQQRWIWGTMLALTVLLVVSTAAALGRGAFLQGLQQEDVRSTLRTMALCLALAYGVVCGALLLAGEKEDGTQFFLDRLSPKRGPVWQAKLAVGATLTLALAVTLLALGLALGFMDWHWLIRLPLFSLEALTWGLLGGALYRKVLPAVLAGTFFLAVAWIVPQVTGSWTAFLAMKAALALAGGWLSWRSYTQEDRTRTVAVAPPKPKRISPSAVLGWTFLRQGRWVLGTCLIGTLVTGIFLEQAPLIIWPIATWLIGTVCGLTAFAPEQNGGQLFWGNQRLPAGRIWLWKIWLWGLVATAFIVLLMGEALTIHAVRDASRSQQTTEDWLTRWRGNWYFFVNLDFGCFFSCWVTHGFAVGVLCGLLFRRLVIAAIIALVIGSVWHAILDAVCFCRRPGNLAGLDDAVALACRLMGAHAPLDVRPAHEPEIDDAGWLRCRRGCRLAGAEPLVSRGGVSGCRPAVRRCRLSGRYSSGQIE